MLNNWQSLIWRYMDKPKITSTSLLASVGIGKRLQSNCQEMKVNDNETQVFDIRYGTTLVCCPLHWRPSAHGCWHKADIYDVSTTFATDYQCLVLSVLHAGSPNTTAWYVCRQWWKQREVPLRWYQLFLQPYRQIDASWGRQWRHRILLR